MSTENPKCVRLPSNYTFRGVRVFVGLSWRICMRFPSFHNLIRTTSSTTTNTSITMKTSALIAAIACGSASAFAPSTTSARQTQLNLAVGETGECIELAPCFALQKIPHLLLISSYAHIFVLLHAAPDFSLVDQNGKTFTRSKNKKPLVVYFYPADSTPGCTVQANAFQEEIQSIRKQYKADVVGVSGQGAESKQKFASELGLDFSILADEGDEVRTAFGVPKAAFGFLPGRVTYVLDMNGVCTSVYDNLAGAASHIEAAKDALDAMQPVKKEFSLSLPF